VTRAALWWLVRVLACAAAVVALSTLGGCESIDAQMRACKEMCSPGYVKAFNPDGVDYGTKCVCTVPEMQFAVPAADGGRP
jgi:hypothetical protein